MEKGEHEMTPQRAKELLPTITAFAEGKKIQRRYNLAMGCKWIDDINPTWSNDYDYRLKPEPGEWWICDACKAGWDFNPNQIYCFGGKATCKGRIIHVREVMEEGK
jgi:hypothetical protein